jgi:hypothetical protein
LVADPGRLLVGRFGQLVDVVTNLQTRTASSGYVTATFAHISSDAQVLHLKRLLRSFAVRHPGGALVVDLAQLVCPQSAPCGPDVDGRRPRPDGAHFSPAGSVWAAQWLLGEIARSAATHWG